MAAFRSDHLLVRDYVTALDHLQYTQLPDGVVAILLTHSNLSANHVDIRLDLHSTIADTKEKFRKHIGTPAEFQRLILKEHGNTICELADNSKMLGFYSVTSGMEIHVIDTDPFSLSRGGGLTDVSLVEKFRMSDEDYDKRQNSMRQYIKDQRAKDPNFKLKQKGPPGAAASQDSLNPPGADSVEHISVGSRCEIMPGARRGTVRFVGEHANMTPGHWVGVELDEPLGKSDGTAKGLTIFECKPDFGAFVRGRNVTIGDFKVRDLMDSDEEDDAGDGCCGAEEEEI